MTNPQEDDFFKEDTEEHNACMEEEIIRGEGG